MADYQETLAAARAENARLMRERDAAQEVLRDADKGSPIYKAVERVLDEHSAWIARPNDAVTRAIALAAGVAWMAREPVDPLLEEIEMRLIAARVENDGVALIEVSRGADGKWKTQCADGKWKTQCAGGERIASYKKMYLPGTHLNKDPSLVDALKERIVETAKTKTLTAVARTQWRYVAQLVVNHVFHELGIDVATVARVMTPTDVRIYDDGGEASANGYVRALLSRVIAEKGAAGVLFSRPDNRDTSSPAVLGARAVIVTRIPGEEPPK